MRPKILLLKTILILILAVFAVPHSGNAVTSAANTSQPDVQLNLTIEEQQWLTRHPVLRIAGPKAFPPFHFFEKDGTVRGMASDYADLILNRLGLSKTVLTNAPWPEVLQKIRNREIDLIACSAKTKKREEYLLFSNPYLSFPLVIITKKEAPFVGGFADLYDKKVTFIPKVSTYEWLKQDQIHIEPLFVKTPIDAMVAVSLGQADAHIENLAAASYMIQHKGLSNLKIACPTPYGNYNLYMAVRKDWPELISILNKTLDSIQPGQHSAIQNRWLTVRYEHGLHPDEAIMWILAILAVACIGFLTFFLWNRRLKKEITERKSAEQALKEKESTLSSIFLAAPTGIGIVSDRVILNANDKLLEMTGYKRDELVGKSARILYPNDNEFNYVGREKYQQISEKGTGTVETIWQRKDGNNIHIILSSTPLNQEEWSQGVTFTALDITDLKLAEQERITSEQRFRAIVEDQTDFICRFTRKGRVTFANNAICRFFEKDPNTIIGKKFNEFLPKNDSMTLKSLVQNLTPEAPVHTHENKGKLPSGMEYWGQWTNHGIFDDGGNLIEIQAVGKDITRKRQLEEQLQQSHKMEAVGTLAGGIAHDFNNILGIILGSTELMRYKLPESNLAAKYIDEIITACMRAKELVGQLLTFSRKSVDIKTVINLSAIVKESLKLLRSTIPANIEFISDIKPAPLMIEANATQIHQVMINLCTNAADAMSDTGGSLNISLEAIRLKTSQRIIPGTRTIAFPAELPKGNYAKLTLSDTGQGITPGKLGRIFDPYFTTKAMGKGTGLGLSVALGIIQNHNGSIRVTTIKDQGTTFEVLFPSTKKVARPTGSLTQNLPGGEEQILVIDDEASMVMVTKKRLEKLGYNVHGITDSGKALELFKTDPERFDLILTDMAMPGMTGGQLAKEMLAVNPDVRIIICTGYSEMISEKKAAAIGIRRYINKPMEIKHLALSVREVLDETGKQTNVKTP